MRAQRKRFKQQGKIKLHLLLMHRFFFDKQIICFSFSLKKLYNIKKHTKKEPLILLHETFRIWNYPNMRYKATPQGQTASYSILLCHQEEKIWNWTEKLFTPPKRNPLFTLPTPECYSIIHQHNRNTEMINVVTVLLTGQKEREVWLHFIQQYFKSTGKERPVPLYLCSATRTHLSLLYFPKTFLLSPF